ncbi:MAG TPA: hypothetical protein VGH28_26905 [Polyangiaceae bacterium]
MSVRPDLLRVRCPACATTGTARWSDEHDAYVVDLAHETDGLCPYIGMPEALDLSREAPRNDNGCE